MNRLLAPSLLVAGLIASSSTSPLFANHTLSDARSDAALALQDKLSRIVERHLQQVVKYLDLTDKAVTAKNAKQAADYLEQAETQWKTFQEWNKGKYDPKHPDVVAAAERIVVTRKGVASLTGKVTPAPAKPTPAAKTKMSRIVERHLEKVERLIEGLEESLTRKDVKGSGESLDYAAKEWKAFRDWNKGKYDPQDPRVVAATKKMESLTTRVRALESSAGDMSKVLNVVLTLILEDEKEMQAAIKKAGYTLRSFESNSGDYRYIGNARKALKDLPPEMTVVNDRLLGSVAVCRQFRKQIGSMDDLRRLVKDGYQAESALKRVEAAPSNWLAELVRVTKQALEAADEDITNYEKKLQGIDSLEESQKVYVANNAFEWGVDHADMLLQIVPAAFPELTPEGQETFPAYVKARNGFMTRASGLEERSRKIATVVGKVRKQIVDAAANRIEAARFPKAKYTGKEWEAAEQDIRKAFEKKIRNKKLLKISIDSPWKVRKEARWRNDAWVIGTYRYIGAWCVAKLESGKCYVYHMSFRNTRLADGQWSPLEQWSVGHVYEIAEKNIDK